MPEEHSLLIKRNIDTIHFQLPSRHTYYTVYSYLNLTDVWQLILDHSIANSLACMSHMHR